MEFEMGMRLSLIQIKAVLSEKNTNLRKYITAAATVLIEAAGVFNERNQSSPT